LVKQLTTVSEFDEWQAYFEERHGIHEKADYYAAATIRAIFASQGAKVGKVQDYLLEFEFPKPNPSTPPIDSKSVWLGMFNIDSESQ
jgi:hypothetical protein